ncbi:MAG: GFA family protein [Pseudomonadota bacterium]
MSPRDGLHVVRGADRLTLYEWRTKTAKHFFCATCGTCMYHRRRSNPNEYGVKMGALESVNPPDHCPIPWTEGINHPSDA